MRSEPPPDALKGRRDWIEPPAIIAFAALGALLLVEPTVRATLLIEAPNEGWNAVHALHAFTGDLYPPRSALFINNYPPLWFWLTGALALWFGDPIFPGRVVAFAAFASTALAIFALARRLGLGAGAAALGALAFAVTLEAHFATYVGLAEPQMLAEALATTAAAIAARAASRWSMIAAVLLTIAALLVKPVVIGLPIAATLWLFLRRRPYAGLWVSLGAAGGVVAFGSLVALYGPPFAQNLTAPRSFAWERLGTNLALASRVAVPLIALAAPAWLLRRRWDDATTFAALAIAAAFVPIVVFGSALGVSINIGFDLVIAASLGLAVGWDRAAAAFGNAGGRAWRAAVALAFVVVSLIWAPRGSLDFSQVRREQATATSLASLRDRISGLRGPVVCETLSICVWAGKPSAADLWKLHHERTLAFFDPAPMLARVSSGGYAAVVTLSPVASLKDDGHLPGLAAALAAGYAPPVRYANGTSLYLPKAAR